jgi:NADPH:quinone reductase-like Zn-dependent oxidoreductase
MKAVRIHAYGDANVLRYEDVPEPDIGDDDILVRVVGSSVNPIDWKVREGHLKEMIRYILPFTPGWDVSGVVHAVGRNASKFQVGDAVYGRPDVARDGTYAEFIAVRESELALKPRTISHIEAAVLPLAGIAAWESLITVGKVAAGQRVLVHGAAGGVGSLAVQIAKARGAHVIGTGSAGSRMLLESLHVDEFVDYHSQQLQDIARNMDLVFDTIGGATQEASWSLLAPNGILVSITDPPSQERAQKLGLRSAFVFIQPNASVLEQMAQWVDGGVLRPVIGAEFALPDIRKAHALSEAGHVKGKIALYVGAP